MREMNGDLFELAKGKTIVIATNGMVDSKLLAVMGRGCAKQAADLWPTFPKLLGERLKLGGNVVNAFQFPGYKAVLSFPTKNDWRDPSNLSLIMQSAAKLVRLVDAHKLPEVYMPRVGCGHGKLDWALVKAVLEPVLDDRFVVVDY